MMRSAGRRPTLGTVLAACVLVLLGPAMFGCGGGSSTGPEEETAADLVRRGWERFTAGDLGGARTLFEAAEEKDPALAAAPLGLGWTRLRQRDLVAADVALRRAASLGESGADLHAAAAVVARDHAPVDWERALAAADAVLDRAADYVFRYDPSFDRRDVRLIAGQAAFALGDYIRARAEVIALGGPALDPFAPDFVSRLLSALDAIRT